MMGWRSLVLAVAAAVAPGASGAQEAAALQPMARPPIDAPELAQLGRHPVGVERMTMVQPAQADPLTGDTAPGIADRELPLTIWYPAAAGGPAVTYQTALSGADGKDVAFAVPGIASERAAAAPGKYPLVILAHGYGNTPEVLSWLGENLASKGYVVVAPAFRDPPISIRTPAARAGPIARRPLDIAFVAREAQRRARAKAGVFAGADPERTALIGYSMGGYGVLTAAGAPLDPRMAALSRDVLAPYASGGRKARELLVPNVKAVVALAPAVRFGDVPVWSGAGAGAVNAPTLFIVGSQDRAVGYDAVRAAYGAPAGAPRYLLTFKEAGHSIALSGAPPAMRQTFWDLDWLEDATWRKDRLLGIEAHFITAFLDRYVKGEAGKGTYLDGLIPDADKGQWPDAPVGRSTAFSPGTPPITLWKGFQPSRAIGMTFEARP